MEFDFGAPRQLCAVSRSNTSYTVGNATTKLLFGVFSVGVTFAMSSHLVCLQISTWLHVYLHCIDLVFFGYIHILAFCPLQHSLIAMSSCWIFWTKWMWSDPKLLYAFYLKLYLSKSYAFYWNCRMSSLRPCQQKIQRQPLSPFSMLIPPHEIWRSRNDHPTIQACVGRGTNPKIPHNGHVFLRCESPGAPV